jgi:1-deoxy-D-xylulose-5-phosphate synthase
MVQQSLAAAETLGAEGIRVTVVNCRYLKPHDESDAHALSAHHQACCWWWRKGRW